MEFFFAKFQNFYGEKTTKVEKKIANHLMKHFLKKVVTKCL